MSEPEGWFARHWLKLVLSLAVAAGFAYLMHAGALPIVPSRDAFERVRWWTLPGYFVLWCGVHFVRAGRWYFLLAPIHRVLTNKYYVDELYNATVIRGTLLFATFLALFDVYVIDGAVNLVRHATVFVFGHGSRLFDTYVVDGAVNGVAYTAKGGSTMFRRMQNGFVQNYAAIMGAGIVLLAVVYLFTKA